MIGLRIDKDRGPSTDAHPQRTAPIRQRAFDLQAELHAIEVARCGEIVDGKAAEGFRYLKHADLHHRSIC